MVGGVRQPSRGPKSGAASTAISTLPPRVLAHIMAKGLASSAISQVRVLDQDRPARAPVAPGSGWRRRGVGWWWLVWPGLRGPCGTVQRQVSGGSTLSGRSGRCRPCCGQSEAVAFDNQPTLGYCVSTGCLECRHLPVADVRCLDKMVQCQLVADTAISVVHNYVEELSSFWLCRAHSRLYLGEWTSSIFPNGGHFLPRSPLLSLSAVQSAQSVRPLHHKPRPTI
jgi:hypothetical protein